MFQALAQTLVTYPASGCQAFEFGKCKGIEDIINAGSGTFFAVIWFIAIIYLAYGGVLYITAAGDKAKAETAKTALTNALIGIVVVLGINVLTNVIQGLFTGGVAVQAPKVTITGALPTRP